MIDRPIDILRVFPVRKTKSQKQAFCDAIQSYLAAVGYDAAIEKGKMGAKNIVFGNPETASYLITAHYDTPAAMPFPNLITPCSFLPFLGYQLLITIMILLIAFMPVLILVSLGMRADNASRIWHLSLYAILALMLIGPANSVTQMIIPPVLLPFLKSQKACRNPTGIKFVLSFLIWKRPV